MWLPSCLGPREGQGEDVTPLYRQNYWGFCWGGGGGGRISFQEVESGPSEGAAGKRSREMPWGHLLSTYYMPSPANNLKILERLPILMQ